MAETKSAGEIEDILSSIRRLVSEDLRPAPRAQIVSRMVVEDKLILTPALRVVPSVARPAPAHAPAAPLPRLHLGAAEGPRTTPEVLGDLSQSVGQQSMDWESETGDPAPDLESLDWSSFTFARRPAQETWSPPPRGPDKPQAVPNAPAQAATAETVAQDWADEAEAEALADLAQPEAEVIPGSAQEDDNIFSEQVLRELVRDLIREQLQGDLGERITRNIRKLVKAEIARALDVRALD